MNANDITILIDNYTPSTLVAADWHAIGADVRSWVHAAEPGHPHRARDCWQQQLNSLLGAAKLASLSARIRP